MTNSGAEGSTIAQTSADEAERRRLRRWFWGLGILAAIGLFGLLRYNYPTLTTPAGTKYVVTFQGRHVGTDGKWTELDYLTHTRSLDSTFAEVQEILPFVADLAVQQGDSEVHIVALDRRFSYGIFTLDRRVFMRFHAVGTEWRMF